MNLSHSWLTESNGAAAFPLPPNSVLDPGERLAVAYGLPSELNAIQNAWGIDTTLSDSTLQWICQEDIVPAAGMGLSYVGASGEETALDFAAAPGNAFRLSFTDGAAVETADFQAGDPFGDVAVRKGKPFQQGLLAYRGFEGLRGEKRYELRDHLGNVTAVVSDGKLPVGYALSPGDVDYFVAEVVSARDYYPFGMGMPGRGVDLGGYRYGFNGYEKDDDVAGNGNSYTTHYRQYDPRLGRWKSLDPAKEKYPSMSSYSAHGGNPILILDSDGDTLRVHGRASETTKFKALLDKTFAGAITVQVAENGTVTLHGDRSILNANDKALYDYLNTVISDAKTTDVYLLKELERQYAAGGGWQGATVNGKKVNSIDVYDVEKFAGQAISPEGLIIHEIWETYQDQVKGIHDFETAHQKALEAQAQVDGNVIGAQWGDEPYIKTGSGAVYFLYVKGGKLFTLEGSVTNLNIESITVKEGWIVQSLEGKGTTTLRTGAEVKKYQEDAAK